ncbi:kinase-like domain-containing protein [Naematelia encephala]|uniref:PAN2-PAN3 deadenylation complex subunit PAN3 n=1 Tax=Naematelia encephala TaxID=71784 RepID=A0A1Y2AFF3_9TREE|nr:kinase-like domain-containing protein [Naematelia encephala]
MAAPAPRSAAIQIVRPNASAPAFKPAAQPQQPQPQSQSQVASPVTKTRTDNTQRLCRNVLIYGTCKYQDQGCPFYHPPPGVDPTLLESGTQNPTPLQAPLAATQVPPAQDAPRSAGLGVAAPVFVPKTPNPVADVPSQPSTPSVHPGHLWPQASDTGLPGSTDGSAMGYDEGMLGNHQGMESNMYMQQPSRHTLDYHLYTSPLPHVSNPPISTAPLHSFFIPDDLRRVLQARQDAIQALPSGPTGLPAELGVYHTLVPLGHPVSAPSRVWGHPSPVYRATSGVDGNVYALRRIEGFKLVNEQAFGAIDTWRRLRHPNIVGLREAFTTKAFNDNSLVLVYDYHPDSTTLLDEHLAPDPPPRIHNHPRQGMPIPERVLWSYITQIANAIKAIHASGMAVRGLDMSKVLLTGKNRVRLNGCGIMDVLAYDANTPIAMFQQEDLVSFGKLIMHLTCEFFQPGQHPSGPLDHITRHYSPDVKNIVLFLISKPQPSKSIDDAIRLSGMRMLNELDAMQMYVDVLEGELGGEIENGRLVRLLIKLGFINERAEFELDPRWSDTGDRYILKLFRDFVFHSIGVDGNPVLDLSHVLTCLNKLDAGLDERIMLVSRDDQSCLVVSYREIKSCIEVAYGELRNAGNPMRGLR